MRQRGCAPRGGRRCCPAWLPPSSTSCWPAPAPGRSRPSRRPRARSSRSTCCCPGCRGCATSGSTPVPPSPAPSTSTRASASCRARTPSPPPARCPTSCPCEIYCHSLLGPLDPRARPGRHGRADPHAVRAAPAGPAVPGGQRGAAGGGPRGHAALAGLGARRADRGRAAARAGRPAVPGGAHPGGPRAGPRDARRQHLPPVAAVAVGRDRPSRSAPGASRRSTSGCWSAARVPAAAAASAASRVTTRRRRSSPAHRRARCPARTPGRAGSAAWTVSRSSCSAPSRSGTSGSSGSGSPTCSGILKSVAVAPAELEGAFAEGIGFDGSAIEGFARVYESDMLAQPDPTTFQILPWRGEIARHRPHVLRHPDCPTARPSFADPRYVLKRALAKAADLGLHLLHAPRDRVLPVRAAGRPRAGRRCRSTTAGYFDHVPARHRPRLPPRRRSRCSRRWASRSSSATTRAARARTRSTCATPTR